MNIKPKKNPTGLKRIKGGGKSSVQHSYKVALGKLRRLFGEDVQVHRVDFAKFKACIKGKYFPAVLDIRRKEFIISFKNVRY